MILNSYDLIIASETGSMSGGLLFVIISLVGRKGIDFSKSLLNVSVNSLTMPSHGVSRMIELSRLYIKEAADVLIDVRRILSPSSSIIKIPPILAISGKLKLIFAFCNSNHSHMSQEPGILGVCGPLVMILTGGILVPTLAGAWKRGLASSFQSSGRRGPFSLA